MYQCNASNPLGYVFANAFINVMGNFENLQILIIFSTSAHAPQFSSPEKQHLKVTVGTTVDIDCVVRAAPAPIIKLVNIHNQPIKEIPGKLRIFENNTIRIYDVTKEDSALFYCNVTNKWVYSFSFHSYLVGFIPNTKFHRFYSCKTIALNDK